MIGTWDLTSKIDWHVLTINFTIEWFGDEASLAIEFSSSGTFVEYRSTLYLASAVEPQLSSTNSMNIVRHIYSTHAWRKFCPHTNARNCRYCTSRLRGATWRNIDDVTWNRSISRLFWGCREAANYREWDHEGTRFLNELIFLFLFLDSRASWSDAREGSPVELHRRAGSLYHIRA